MPTGNRSRSIAQYPCRFRSAGIDQRRDESSTIERSWERMWPGLSVRLQSTSDYLESSTVIVITVVRLWRWLPQKTPN